MNKPEDVGQWGGAAMVIAVTESLGTGMPDIAPDEWQGLLENISFQARCIRDEWEEEQEREDEEGEEE